ncbi:16S rRNA (uracil(1498)-N(3))-methyltransferase [Handroanthus impetiginosus]|uniref:16S rRNA (uracil(1498)-N(3))-methyltransferase n=1 Tax=Handroanthus impetiginosus TaxID=429701 RepID=A0A2G9I9R4_9LAMI|nr:16S rRNA (uracil(1498)-N(3))-methyltransferase [Handroanthus impetiginosus]
MKTLVCSPRIISLLNCSSLHSSLRALSSSSSDYSNQSRGGLPRFFSETLPPSKGGVVRVGGDEFWHMTKVLRLGINDRVELFNGKGGVVEGRIDKIDRAGVDFEALENPKLVSTQTPQWHVFAAFSTLKGGRADWLVEKCTELGALSVTPLLTERSRSISENRVDRLQRVILAAAKQCQRLHEMILKPPIVVGELLPVVAQSRLSFVAVAEATPVFKTLNSLKKEPTGVIIIGPEGDFTEKELKSIMKAGAIATGLGPHRLRVETATIALLSTLMLWSDSQETVSS